MFLLVVLALGLGAMFVGKKLVLVMWLLQARDLGEFQVRLSLDWVGMVPGLGLMALWGSWPG